MVRKNILIAAAVGLACFGAGAGARMWWVIAEVSSTGTSPPLAIQVDHAGGPHAGVEAEPNPVRPVGDPALTAEGKKGSDIHPR